MSESEKEGEGRTAGGKGNKQQKKIFLATLKTEKQKGKLFVNKN